MSDQHKFTQLFLRGLRSVPGYVESLCDSCQGACGERPDDQCLISAWSSYIQSAHAEAHDPEEMGRRCAVAQLQQRQADNLVLLPCEQKTPS